jgi:hypothetical protein
MVVFRPLLSHHPSQDKKEESNRFYWLEGESWPLDMASGVGLSWLGLHILFAYFGIGLSFPTTPFPPPPTPTPQKTINNFFYRSHGVYTHTLMVMGARQHMRILYKSYPFFKLNFLCLIIFASSFLITDDVMM